MTLAQQATATRTSGAHGNETPHEIIGFELGWDHAHYGVALPAAFAQERSCMRDGWLAGSASFGTRTLQATPPVRQWLQLRLHAWLRGHGVELLQVTPNYLQQIKLASCPVTRTRLDPLTSQPGEACVVRVRHDAAYAAGNLAMLSARAERAKGAHDHLSATAQAHRASQAEDRMHQGLSADEWTRLATLCSYVTPMAHDAACVLPMRVLPPNRLRLFNPAQALQAFISLQLTVPNWSHRLARFEELLKGADTRRAFQMFFHALLPRVLEAGKLQDPQSVRWAIEDAWRNPLCLQRWTAFASRMTADECEALVKRAAARNLGAMRIGEVPDRHAIEGWSLETQGRQTGEAEVGVRMGHPAAGSAGSRAAGALAQLQATWCHPSQRATTQASLAWH